jgi:SSS family solute:Na+ symporter
MNMYVFGAAAATFFCPLVAAFYWKRATTTGVIASLIVGAGTTILWISMKNPYVHSSIAGIGFSALVLIIVSLLTAPQSEEQATKLMKI